jgi:hypothetical protein
MLASSLILVGVVVVLAYDQGLHGAWYLAAVHCCLAVALHSID